jgi:nucleotide-binding universal stress UspA family protein
VEKVLVGYDGSEPARRALDRAAEVANGASILVISAVPVHAGGPRGFGPVDPEDLTEAHQELVEATNLLAAKGIQAQVIEAIGDPADALVDAAERQGADLIVVGTRGISPAKRLVLGSVSSKVTTHAHCDVLIVR